jgi:hypothetical protein
MPARPLSVPSWPRAPRSCLARAGASRAHPARRGPQQLSRHPRCLRVLTGATVSLGTISAIVHESQQRALAWLATHAPPASSTLALDELYTSNRAAYLSIVDTQSWAVWAAHGPLDVDTESWTLVLWLAQERGLRWHATSSDGGGAIHAACQAVDPHGQHGRDVWHVLHTCAQVQGRLDRQVTALTTQQVTVARQAARVAAGRPPHGA